MSLRNIENRRTIEIMQLRKVAEAARNFLINQSTSNRRALRKSLENLND